jgi:hypothetical protein
MSRIILTKYDNGDDHIVVGWDRAQDTFYWQEFNREPEDWDSPEAEEWEEMLGYSGYRMHQHTTTHSLVESASENVRQAMLNAAGKDVFSLLDAHRELPYPESNAIVDLSDGG